MRALFVVLFAIAAVLAFSCSERPAPLPSQSIASERVSPAIDIATLARRARFAFRSEGNDLVVRRATFVATVTKDGAFRLLPRRRTTTLGLVTRSADPAIVTRVPEDGSVRIRRGSIVEHIASIEDGVEQSWELAEQPPGNADLEIRVHVDGYIARPDGRDVLLDDGAGSIVRYGAPRLIDAHDIATDIDLRIDGSDLVLTIRRAVLERSSYPAVLDPKVSPESVVDAPIVGPTGQAMYAIDMAPGKDGKFFVVWMDRRTPHQIYDYFGDSQIFGARIAANGTILDPTGIVIAQSSEQEQDDPRVTFDGTGTWLVVWGQYSHLENDCEIYTAARVTDAGAVLDGGGLRLGCVFAGFHAGFDGTAFEVTGAAGTAYYGWRIPPAGPVVVPPPTTLLPLYGFASIGCDAKTTCLLVWYEAGSLRASLLGANGLATPAGNPIAPFGSNARIVFDGTNFVVEFNGYFVRVSPADGKPLDAAPISIGSPANVFPASDGTNYLFAWVDATKQIKGIRFTKAGVQLDATPLSLTTAATAGRLANAGANGQFLLAWFDSRTAGAEGVYIGRVSSAGAPLDGNGVHINGAANRQFRPAIAKSAMGYLAVWEDFRDDPFGAKPALYMTRLSETGAAIDVPAKKLAAVGEIPVVASDGTDFVILYEAAGSIVLARVSGANGSIVTGPTTLAAARGPSIFHDGTRYVAGFVNNAARAMRIDNLGAPIDTPIDLGIGDEPVGAFDGQGYLFAGIGNVGVVARRLTKDFTLDGAPITINTTNLTDDHLALTYDSGAYILTWRRALQDDTPRGDIYAARLSANGTVLDAAIPVALGAPVGLFPSIVPMHDGVGPLVVWSDDRRTDRLRDHDIFGAVVRSKDGVVLDPTGFVISDNPGNEFFPTGVNAGPGRALLAYQRMDHGSGFGQARVKTRFVQTGAAIAGACKTNDDCASRACSDGVCCERACNGFCETCATTPGTCTKITNAPDPDSCGNDRTCDANSKCMSKLGGPCTTTSDCLEGTCSQGICCERACDGACETCAAPAGKCTLRTARAPGQPSCAPYACDGKNATCPSECTSDEQCPHSGRCDVPTKRCVDGALCIDGRSLGRPGQAPVSCAPYICELASCRTTCRNTADCLYPAVCSESGECVATPPFIALGGGCALITVPSSQTDEIGLLASCVLVALGVRRRRLLRSRSRWSGP